MKLYVVQMYRWGDFDSHSYVLGVYDKKHKAQSEAVKEFENRGCGKYLPCIHIFSDIAGSIKQGNIWTEKQCRDYRKGK